jgi:capsular exopolysaccharide synthesis family protein
VSSGSSLPTHLLIGLIAGLLAGSAAAFAASAMDTSVKDGDQLTSATDSPFLGSISIDDQVAAEPLAMQARPMSMVAENFRQLRTNLQFIDIASRSRVIAVTSAVPAEAKSTSVANLGIALSATGARVLLLEGDLRRPRLADLFGMERAAGLTSVLVGRLRFERAVQHWPLGNVDVLASGPIPPNPSELLSSNVMQGLLQEARKMYDYVLVDLPPVLPVADAASIAAMTDGYMLLCRSGSTSRHQAEQAAKALRAGGCRILGSILTFAPRGKTRAYSNYISYYGNDQMAQ